MKMAKQIVHSFSSKLKKKKQTRNRRIKGLKFSYLYSIAANTSFELLRNKEVSEYFTTDLAKLGGLKYRSSL